MKKAVLALLVLGGFAFGGLSVLDARLQRPFREAHRSIRVGDRGVEVYTHLQTAGGDAHAPALGGVTSFPGPFCHAPDIPRSVVRWQTIPTRAVEVRSSGLFWLERQNRACPGGRCWELVDTFCVASSEFLPWLEENGCALFPEVLDRIEGPARFWPPLTHDFFMVRYDGSGRVVGKTDIHPMGDAAYWDTASSQPVSLSREGRIYERLAKEMRTQDHPLIVAATTLPGSRTPGRPGVERLDAALLENLREQPAGAIPSGLARSEHVILYDQGDVFPGSGFPSSTFSRSFPWAGGYAQFSPTAWSADSAVALVYVTGWQTVHFEIPEWDLADLPADRFGYYQFDLEGGDPPVFVGDVVEERGRSDNKD